MSAELLPRNQRNNNPGNVDRTDIQWLGMAKDQSSDPRFIVFVAPEWGFRCMARILQGHFDKGATTVKDLINSWAPPVENDTSAYVTDVANRMGVDVDAPLMFPSQLAPILKAIAIHEGGCPWPDSTISQGIRLALST